MIRIRILENIVCILKIAKTLPVVSIARQVSKHNGRRDPPIAGRSLPSVVCHAVTASGLGPDALLTVG